MDKCLSLLRWIHDTEKLYFMIKQMGICAIILASYLSMIANSNCNAKLATLKHIKK